MSDGILLNFRGYDECFKIPEWCFNQAVGAMLTLETARDK
jgi:hypothetical protein